MRMVQMSYDLIKCMYGGTQFCLAIAEITGSMRPKYRRLLRRAVKVLPEHRL